MNKLLMTTALDESTGIEFMASESVKHSGAYTGYVSGYYSLGKPNPNRWVIAIFHMYETEIRDMNNLYIRSSDGSVSQKLTLFYSLDGDSKFLIVGVAHVPNDPDDGGGFQLSVHHDLCDSPTVGMGLFRFITEATDPLYSATGSYNQGNLTLNIPQNLLVIGAMTGLNQDGLPIPDTTPGYITSYNMLESSVNMSAFIWEKSLSQMIYNAQYSHIIASFKYS